MSYAIFRVAKVGSSHDIAGIQIHDRRERNHSNSNPDIDFSRSQYNYSLCNNADKSFNDFIDRRIAEGYKGKKAIRKDAVRMVSAIFTSDNDFFANLTAAEQQDYFRSCYDWAVNRWGSDNIISANIHMDELTPHMHLNFVPLTSDGRLSAKDCIGSGSRALQQLQDDFYQAVGKKYGLERGKRADLDNGDKPRRHQSVNEYKTATKYYQEQKNAAEGVLQALQGEVDRLNDILHAEPQNAVESVPVPSMAKLALSKENKDKVLISPSDVEQLQDLAKACAVSAADNARRSAELDAQALACAKLAEDTAQERDKILAAAEAKSNDMIAKSTEKALQREREANKYYFAQEKIIKEREEKVKRLEEQADYRLKIIADRQADVADKEKELENKEADIAEQLKDLAELTDRPDEHYQKIIDGIQQELDEANNKSIYLQMENEGLKRDKSCYKLQNKALQNELSELNEVKERDKSDFAAKLSEKEDDIAELWNKINAAESQKKELEAKIDELAAKLDKQRHITKYQEGMYYAAIDIACALANIYIEDEMCRNVCEKLCDVNQDKYFDFPIYDNKRYEEVYGVIRSDKSLER